MTCFSLARWIDAIVAFRRALELGSSDPVVRRMLCEALCRRPASGEDDDGEGAERLWEEAMSTAPDYAPPTITVRWPTTRCRRLPEGHRGLQPRVHGAGLGRPAACARSGLCRPGAVRAGIGGLPRHCGSHRTRPTASRSCSGRSRHSRLRGRRRVLRRADTGGGHIGGFPLPGMGGARTRISRWATTSGRLGTTRRPCPWVRRRRARGGWPDAHWRGTTWMTPSTRRGPASLRPGA